LLVPLCFRSSCQGVAATIHELRKRGTSKRNACDMTAARVGRSLSAPIPNVQNPQRCALRGVQSAPFHLPRLSAMIFVDCIADWLRWAYSVISR